MRTPVVAVFVMPQAGHFYPLAPLVAGLCARGAEAHVFTDQQFEHDVERLGARFVDMFAEYPVNEADRTSHPAPCRYVTFAGRYAEQILREVEQLEPDLVIHDSHAVIGRVVGRVLDVPYVHVCAGHNVSPGTLPELLETLPKTYISPACERAVQTLHERYGYREASPFSFVPEPSPYLNVCCEPPEFLERRDREALEPVAFHGCLVPETPTGPLGPPQFGSPERLKLFVSFGTVVWRYFPREALAGMKAIAAVVADRPDLTAFLSLGGNSLPAASIDELRRPNVLVKSFVDQPAVLREADAFVTHHGMNSTHEAIDASTPMISYPFFWDQLPLARKCQSFGLAVPLAAPLAPIRSDDLARALAELTAERPAITNSLARARGWEVDVMANREAVVERAMKLIAP
ncbi:MAG: glycosyltransferase family 1 protein [Solirubrobacterales bacterium]|nr:glycosyltransferase family 1 protein [Solirubrobacterales bacterium]